LVYELDYSVDSTFPAADTTTETTFPPIFQPANPMPVSNTAPVGQRYYWRVRACVEATPDCSDYSPTWWVNVGRNDHDIQADGYDDVLIGMPWETQSGFYQQGAIAVFDGASNFAPMSGDVYYESNEGYRQGYDVAMVDIDGDGYCEAVAGQYGLDGRGRVAIYPGGASGLNTSGTFQPAQPPGFEIGWRYGKRVANAWDLDGDGYHDLAVAKPDQGQELNNEGEVFVYFGGDAFDGSSPTTLSGISVNDQFGAAIDGGGDINADGYDDLIVGAPNEGDGVVRIYFGSSSGISTAADVSLANPGSGGTFGSEVSILGDLDGDGDAEFGVVDGASDIIYVYLGDDAPSSPELTIGSSNANASFEGNIGPMGDVDGDGYGEFAVMLDENLSTMAGARAVIYRGGPTLDKVQDGSLSYSNGANYPMGPGFAEPADYNGDGHADFVAIPYAGWGQRAYVWTGDGTFSYTTSPPQIGGSLNVEVEASVY